MHGSPGKRRLKEGGDHQHATPVRCLDGWHADAAVTVPVASSLRTGAQLISARREGCAGVSRGGRVVGTRLVRSRRGGPALRREPGFSVVRNYVGHGIGSGRCTRSTRSRTTARAERGLQIKRASASRLERWSIRPARNADAPGPVDRRHGGRQPVCPFRAHARLHGGRTDRPDGARGRGDGRRMTTRCSPWAVSVQFSLPVAHAAETPVSGAHGK